MFTRAFFEAIGSVCVRINHEYRDRGGELLYKGAPRVEVVLRHGTTLTAHFLPEEQPRDEDALNIVAYGERRGDPDRIVFLRCEDIARVDVYEPAAKKNPARRRPFGFQASGTTAESPS